MALSRLSMPHQSWQNQGSGPLFKLHSSASQDVIQSNHSGVLAMGSNEVVQEGQKSELPLTLGTLNSVLLDGGSQAHHLLPGNYLSFVVET